MLDGEGIILLCTHTHTCTHPSPNGFFGYIDICFCVIQEDPVGKFLSHLNSQESAIQFTVEVDGKLPFLDVFI